MTAVYPDFLPPLHFADIQKLFMTSILDWHFSDRVVSTERHFMFGHTFMEDGKVMCPWHAWRFDVRDGTWCDNPKVKTDAFEIRVVGADIQVLVPDSAPPTAPDSKETSSD